MRKFQKKICEVEFECQGESSFWVCVCVDSVVVTCTAQNVSSHASELLSQEGHVGLDDVHPLSNSHSGLETNKAQG